MIETPRSRAERAELGKHQPVPSWVHFLGMPVWATGADGTIRYVNKRAEKLLGRTSSQCLGRMCHNIIAGRSPVGERVCSPDCAVRRLAAAGQEIEPVTLRVASRGTQRQVRVIVIPSKSPGATNPLLIHCVLDDENERRFQSYLTRVARRSAETALGEPITTGKALTPREKQVLQLLVRDQSLHTIAAELMISHSTVRNHVQHILAKLGVHSILEAVALVLLNTGEAR